MSDNTEKLLRAFIEAQGFEIEEVRDTYINGEKFKGNDPLVHFTPMDTVTIELNYKVTKGLTPAEKIELARWDALRGGR